MTASNAVMTALEETAARWREAQLRPDIQAVARIAAAHGFTAARIAEFGARTARMRLPEPEWKTLAEACGKQGIPEAGYVLPRFILFNLGRDNLARVGGLPLSQEVKLRLLDQFQYVCSPDREMEQLLNPGHYGFRVMCKFMLLERFPAGQSDWEISGVPRSSLGKMPIRDVPRALRCLYLRAGGHAPFFENHTAFRREAPILTEEDDRATLRRMADSLRLQPNVRGFMGVSWLLSPNLAEASPHLAWLAECAREYQRFGAVWTEIGEARPDSGFLSGDRKRRKLYETGAWKPRQGLLLWGRRDLLRWRDYHYGATE
jgi:hypothetical protein